MPPVKAEDHIPFDLDQVQPWYKSKNRLMLYCALLPAAFITPGAIGFDNSLTNALQTIPRFQENFGHPSGSSLGFFGASQSLGGAISSFLGPLVADKFGRRFPVSAGSLIIIGATFGQVWAVNFGMFCAFKVILGIGVGLAQLGAPVLVTELCHPKERVEGTSLYNTLIYMGMIIGAWTAFGTVSMDSDWSWKLPCLLQMVCSSYQIFFIWLCPESPRWLIATGRSEEAEAILVKYHADGDRNSELVKWEMREMVQAIEIERANQLPMMDLLKDRGFLHRAFLAICCGTFSQTSGNGLISTYLQPILVSAGIEDTTTITLINGCISIWSWVIGMVCAIATSRLQRRMTFLIGTTGMLVVFVAWTVAQARYEITGVKSAGYAVIALIFLYNAFYSFAWLFLVVAYPLEIANYKFRARLWALTLLSVSLSAFFNAYINPIGLENAQWRYYIYYDIWITIEVLIIYFFFPETSGRTLEEIAEVFDGEKAKITEPGDEKVLEDSIGHVETT